MDTTKKLIILGAGGHAAVIIDLVQAINRIKPTWELVGCLDDGNSTKCLNYPVLGKIATIAEYDKTYSFIIAIGNNQFRGQLAQQYQNCNFATLFHPTAVIGSEVSIGQGTMVLPNVVIHPRTQIGEHVIINTGAIVEHDSKLSNYVHISPRATLCGNVTVGEYTQLGAGSTVIPGVKIGPTSMIGAGSTVIKDCLEIGTYVGVPAKKIK